MGYAARMVEGFRRVAGDEVAELPGVTTAAIMNDQESARVCRLWPRPGRGAGGGYPQNLELNEHGGELMLNLDIVDQLGRVDSPTLVCVGELDPVTPVAAAEEIVRALPEGIAQLEIIPEGGHFTWLDAPDRFWSIIIEFIHALHPATSRFARVDLSLRCQAKDSSSRIIGNASEESRLRDAARQQSAKPVTINTTAVLTAVRPAHYEVVRSLSFCPIRATTNRTGVDR